MTVPSVWAPNATRVDLALEEGGVAMTRMRNGWWQADQQLDPGTDYGFSLDGGTALPDPRSRWQPHGVHGLSRVAEPVDGAVDWNGFDLATSVLYEMHVGTFTSEGTFSAAAKRLDHLLELGIDAVEIMPVNQYPGRHGWGYDGVDLFAPHHPYGGPRGLHELVEECHRRGLGVILDVVYNHLGPEGNYLGEFGPYFTDVYRTPWGPAVNLDGPGSDEVRRFFIENALMWLHDYHFDGLRIDAVHALFDRSAVHLLEEMAERVEELEKELGRPLYLIAESNLNDPRLLWDRSRGGYGLDATWNDDFHHAIHSVLTGEQDGYYCDFGSLTDVAKALRSVYVYDGQYSSFRRRRHGRPVGELGGERFVAYLQNHDQVGNRARGERLGHQLELPMLQIGAALVLLSPFVPMLFQGEEWGSSSPFPYFSDHDDPQLAETVREGRREEFAPFGWSPEDIPDPQDPATYRSAQLDWSAIDESPHAELLDWYRSLIQLRRSTPDLRDGRRRRVSVAADDETRTLVMSRGVVTIAANLGHLPHTVPVPEGARISMSSTAMEMSGDQMMLPPASVAILSAQ